MKTIYKTLFFAMFLFSITINSQSILDNYEGIPIETSLDWWNLQSIPQSVDSMELAGVDIVHISFANQTQLTTYFNNYNMDLLPITTPKPTTGVYNWIQYYTDAKYSVWEAEGTPSEKGNATIFRSPKTEIDPTNQFIRLKNQYVGDTCTMSYGPYYLQDVEYETYENGGSGHELVQYDAEFWLKLECIGQDIAAPTDTLCILQVTQSTWQLACSDTIAEIGVTRENFTSLNTFLPFQIIDYTLENFDCPRETNDILPPQNHYFSTDYLLDGVAPGPRWIRERIEFKVIWKGNPNYNLSYDKVILSDSRGSTLKDPSSFAITNLTAQINSLSSHQNSVFGWLGIDEPQSIDQFEPIRVVDSLIRASTQNQKALVVPIMGCLWDGTFSHFNDAGSMRLNKYEELSERIGNLDIIQNAYMFDTPCHSGNDTLDKCDDDDIRAINISVAANDIYRHTYKYFPNFGASLQCGAVYNTQANQRNVARHEVLYSANLALMYGAKYLQLWRYFPSNDIHSPNNGGTFHGIVDWMRGSGNQIIPIYTDKYFMLKDILSPRLKGLFGKTIKHLVPDSTKVLGKDVLIDPDYSSYYSYIDFIEAEGSQYDTCIVDLGLFTDPEDYSSRYLMTINRYYSTFGNMTIGLKDLSTYKNWQITDLMDTSGVSLVAYNNKVEFNDTIIPGDAKLYNVLPVVRKGGTIAENDTVFYNTTLTDNMLINSAKSVYIKPGMFYTIQDTITLQGSGSTITGEGYLEVAQGGEVIIYNWTNSLFKGKQSDHPKLFWSKFTGTGHTGYKIYRKKETLSFMEIASLSNSARTFTDTTVTIIEGQSQANEVEAEYYVKAIYNNGRSSSNSNTINYKRVEGSGQEKINTGLTRDNFTYQLQQNYPNPFNPVTQISYSIENDGLVELEVLNILGERVASLVNEHKTKGSYTIPFDASQLSSGIYIYRLRSKDFVSSKKMLLLK